MVIITIKDNSTKRNTINPLIQRNWLVNKIEITDLKDPIHIKDQDSLNATEQLLLIHRLTSYEYLNSLCRCWMTNKTY